MTPQQYRCLMEGLKVEQPARRMAYIDRDFADSLAQRCNRGQLDPIHLPDVAMDELS